MLQGEYLRWIFIMEFILKDNGKQGLFTEKMSN